ncbi:hypothetical protein E2C01_037934 [Portunus trituberculatus]|uniref:Uncharacterized protein n=1 Tax=Portunus trituberculatus TaxID=210409 RepID=A0A5B7FFE7_PORTR|nr:hypothetical protein [Portunus trituberculatus]
MKAAWLGQRGEGEASAANIARCMSTQLCKPRRAGHVRVCRPSFFPQDDALVFLRPCTWRPGGEGYGDPAIFLPGTEGWCQAALTESLSVSVRHAALCYILPVRSLILRASRVRQSVPSVDI